MDLRITTNITETESTEGLVAFVPEGEESPAVAALGTLGGEQLQTLLARGEVKSTLYESRVLHGTGTVPTICFMGAGPRSDLEPIILMRLAAAASRLLTGQGLSRLAFLDPGVAPEIFGRSVVQGAVAGAYNSDLMKSRRSSGRTLQSVTLVTPADSALVERAATTGEIVGEAINVARDLVNLPPNALTPTTLADRAEAISQEVGLAFEVLDETRMTELKMGSLLGVAAGSKEPPRLLRMRYGDETAPVKLALVGKGITFDSGGLSLKPAQSMETMKGDMGGGAAVVAGMQAVARLAPKDICVTGYVGATENMPGGSAMRPGDVLTAMNGKTIEVLNTDAEGRLVLADVLAYAESQGATHIVDFATLTGAAMVALGNAASMAVGKPSSWVDDVVSAARDGLERVWPMPLYSEYRRAMDSDIADLRNSGPRWGGALNAAGFLSEFIESVPWTHIDIAGTSFAEEPSAFRPKGGTGVGVGTIVALVERLSTTRES